MSNYSYELRYDLPIFTLTESDIKKPFVSTIEYLEHIGIDQFGGCEFVMPNIEEWKHQIERLSPIKEILLQSFESTGVDGAYYLVVVKKNKIGKKKMNIKASEYHEKYPNKEYIINDVIPKYDDNRYIDNLEEKFLSHASGMNLKKTLEKDFSLITYGAGVDDSFFEQENHTIWNPNHLGTLTDSVAKVYSTNRKILEDKVGVTSPFIYHGGPISTFGLHCEDSNLCSFSYNHGPSAKIWYIIPPKNATQLENVMRKTFPDDFKICDGILQHKYFFLTREFLEKHQIPYARVVQKANQVVVLSPHAYHFGFNTGPNVAEAVNFGTHRWLQKDMISKLTPCVTCEDNVSVVLDTKWLEGHRATKLNLEDKIIIEIAEKIKLPAVPSFLKIEECSTCNITLTSTTTSPVPEPNQAFLSNAITFFPFDSIASTSATAPNYSISSTLTAPQPNVDDNNVLMEIDINITGINNNNLNKNQTKKLNKIRISRIHDSFENICVLSFSIKKLEGPQRKKCNAYNKNDNNCNGRGHWKCDNKCGISNNGNNFCFLPSFNCFGKFHLNLEDQKDGCFPMKVEDKFKRRCATGCLSNCNVKCAKCDKFYCLGKDRNCFYSCKH